MSDGSGAARASEAWSLPSLLKRVCETPAPTFEEQRRAELVAGLLREMGLAPERDEVGNVLVELPGRRRGSTSTSSRSDPRPDPAPDERPDERPDDDGRVALVAHLDTVFAADVDVRVREEAEERWCAPGIGDNSASIAVLLDLAREIAEGRGGPRPPLLVAFTVGEEGLGDLRGARHLVASRGRTLARFLAIDGHLGSIVDAGVGSHRMRVGFRGPGGHSWGDYPSPSAVHALGDAVHALSRVPVPDAPRSSLNVAQVGGGTAINAIAEHAWLTLDLRSLEGRDLARLRAECEKRLRSIARRHGVGVDLETIGSRPAGRVEDAALLTAVKGALREQGIEPAVQASSTDANAAMAEGLPALCFGVYRGGDAHREGEWLDPTSLPIGAAVLRSVLAALAPS